MTLDKVLTCREKFRQHAMDLQATPGHAPQSHWMLQDEDLKDWIGGVQKEYERLRQAGGDPLDGEPVEPEAVIRRLGFAEQKEPLGFLDCLVFTARMVLATTRETVRVNTEMRRLQRRARCTGYWRMPLALPRRCLRLTDCCCAPGLQSDPKHSPFFA